MSSTAGWGPSSGFLSLYLCLCYDPGYRMLMGKILAVSEKVSFLKKRKQWPLTFGPGPPSTSDTRPPGRALGRGRAPGVLGGRLQGPGPCWGRWAAR